jgi:hypothetical protein
MTSEQKELLEFAKMQRYANGSNDEKDVLDAFGVETTPEEKAKLNKFDDETRIFIVNGIASATKPLIDEIFRLTNLGKSEKNFEADTKKLEQDAELAEFLIMQTSINEVE